MQRYEKEMACLHRHEAKLNGIRESKKLANAVQI